MWPRALLAVVVALAAVEIGARIADAPRPQPPGPLVRVPGTRDARDRTEGFVPSPLVVEDEALLWRGRPSTSLSLPVVPSPPAAPASWKLDLDERGFRRVVSARAAGSRSTYRILFLGDSVTLGFNVDQGSEYPAVVERLAEERHAGVDVEVINASVADWSWVQGARFLVREGLSFAPDLVVAAHGLADAAPAWTTDSERLWLRDRMISLAEPPPVLDRSAAWRLLARRAPRTDEEPRRASPGCVLQEAAGNPCRRVSRAETGAMVRQLSESAGAAGVDILLVSLDFDASGSAEAVHEAAIREGVPFLGYAKDARRRLLEQSIELSKSLGLAFPRVPLVPIGRIGPPPPTDRGPRIRLRMRSERSLSRPEVRGTGPEETGFRFAAPLRDDGIDADERAGDGVYSAFVEVPLAVSSLEYRYFDGDVAEFEAPRGIVASHTERIVRFNRDADAPIETFGRREQMSDQVHPDAQGHRLIAEAVLAEIAKVPAFQRATEKTP